jgi:hypothetical protein
MTDNGTGVEKELNLPRANMNEVFMIYRAGSSDNLLGSITASSPGGSKVFQPTGGAFKSTHADSGTKIPYTK